MVERIRFSSHLKVSSIFTHSHTHMCIHMLHTETQGGIHWHSENPFGDHNNERQHTKTASIKSAPICRYVGIDIYESGREKERESRTGRNMNRAKSRDQYGRCRMSIQCIIKYLANNGEAPKLLHECMYGSVCE
jgi:hypothetical protein